MMNQNILFHVLMKKFTDFPFFSFHHITSWYHHHHVFFNVTMPLTFFFIYIFFTHSLTYAKSYLICLLYFCSWIFFNWLSHYFFQYQGWWNNNRRKRRRCSRSTMPQSLVWFIEWRPFYCNKSCRSIPNKNESTSKAHVLYLGRVIAFGYQATWSCFNRYRGFSCHFTSKYRFFKYIPIYSSVNAHVEWCVLSL